MSDFGSRLKTERKRLGFNQTAFGALARVSKDAQLNYESGLRSPDAAYLAALAAHGVDVGFVLTGQRSAGAPLTPEQSALLDSYNQADEAGRAALQAVAVVAKRPQGSDAGRSGNTVTIGGDVGQAVAGDQNNAAPVSFSVGGKRK